MEKKVYVWECGDEYPSFRDLEHSGEEEKIMEECERRGTVYSLDYFQECVNNEELDLSNAFILIR